MKIVMPINYDSNKTKVEKIPCDIPFMGKINNDLSIKIYYKSHIPSIEHGILFSLSDLGKTFDTEFVYNYKQIKCELHIIK